MDPFTQDFITAFKEPLQSCGEFPRYLWAGEKPDEETVGYQLDRIAKSGAAGVILSFTENMTELLSEGSVFFGDLIEFTDMFINKAKSLGMMSGIYDDIIYSHTVKQTEFNIKELSCEKQIIYSGDEDSFGDNVIAVITYGDSNGECPEIIFERGKTISPVRGMCEAYIISAAPCENNYLPYMHGSGEKFIDSFNKLLNTAKPDILIHSEQKTKRHNGNIYSDDLITHIKNTCGYDITGFLPHLFFNIGKLSAKIRLDHSDALNSIADEYFYRPVYEFLSGQNTVFFGINRFDCNDDFYKNITRLSVPGTVVKHDRNDLVNCKTASSAAHLYNRKNTYCAITPETDMFYPDFFENTADDIFAFGCDTVSFDEIPVSFSKKSINDIHIRSPFADDISVLLKKYKTLSSLLSVGHHRCDVAIYYPSGSVYYGNNSRECFDITQKTAEFLFSNGLDFDFIDKRSLQKAICANGRLKASNSEYKALVLSGTDCIEYKCIDKIKQFLDCGGTVVFCGITPYISDDPDKNEVLLKNDISDILSHPGCTLSSSPEEVLMFLNKKITRIFLPEESISEKRSYVHCRVHGTAKLFYVRHVPKDNVCRFAASGVPLSLDIETGEIKCLTGTISQSGFTFIKMPDGKNQNNIILFSEDPPLPDGEINTSGFATFETVLRSNITNDPVISLLPSEYLPEDGVNTLKATDLDCADIVETRIPEAFVGKIIYKNRFTLNKNAADRYIIKASSESQTMTIRINGKPAGVFLKGRDQSDITKLVVNGMNEITVTVSTSLHNYFASSDKNENMLIPTGITAPIIIEGSIEE